MAVSSETRRFQQAEVSSWFTVVGERFKAPLPPAVSRSVPIPAVKGAMTEPLLDNGSWYVQLDGF